MPDIEKPMLKAMQNNINVQVSKQLDQSVKEKMVAEIVRLEAEERCVLRNTQLNGRHMWTSLLETKTLILPLNWLHCRLPVMQE